MIAFFLCGCSAERTKSLSAAENTAHSPVSKTPHSDTLSHEDAKDLWISSRIVNYDITMSYEPGGFLEPAREVLVKVRNGTPISTEVPDKNDKRGRLGFYAPYRTVELMFERIENLRRESPSPVLKVKYNDSYGYPELIDYVGLNPDSFFTFRVLKFQPVDSVGG